MAKPGAVRQSYQLAAPPARVFSALTDPKELKRWFVAKAVVTPRKGGSYRLDWGGGYAMRGKIIAIEPPKLLRLRWIDRLEGAKVFETEARFTLVKRGKGTLLSIEHRGFKSGKKWVQLHGGVASGWAYYLLNLKSVLDHGTDLRSDHDRLN